MIKFSMMAAALMTSAIALPAAAQNVAPATIIIVDMDGVINTSAAGKVALAELKTRLDAINARLATDRTTFTNEATALGQRPAAPGAALTAWETKARGLQTRQQAEETKLGNANQAFQAARQSVVKQINDAAQPIITTLMRERGATIVLPENSTLQHAAANEVTAEVITRLDKTLPRVTLPAATPL